MLKRKTSQIYLTLNNEIASTHESSILAPKSFKFIREINRGSLHQHPMRRVKISSHYIGQRQSLGLEIFPNGQKLTKNDGLARMRDSHTFVKMPSIKQALIP